MNASELNGEVGALRERFDGAVFTGDDDGYDDARQIFNSMIDRRPAVIAQCESPEDVAAAIAFGRERDLELAIRSGGHSVAGAGLTDGGLVIDMRRMNQVTVDPDARTATAQGGATWAAFDAATQPHGMMAPGGRVSTTGVAGLTLGGGSTWLERKFGFACDNLLSVTLTTADGESVTASEDSNSELFWALHGGGGNFGVATELVFRLHELPAATLALLLWPAERGLEVSLAYRDLIDGGAPEELGGGLAYITGPPEEFVPEHLQGTLTAGVIAVYAGTEAEFREALAPILALDPPAQLIAEMPYAEIQCAIDDPPGYRNYWSVEHMTGFPNEAVEIFCRRAEDMVVPSPSQHIMFPWGGAVARGAGDWPLPHREAPWAVHPLGLWERPEDDDQAVEWARGTCADMRPWATGGVYLNFVGDEGADRVRAGYGDANYERLVEVKTQFDPDNVFHLHHNIKPLQPA
jgi:FAD/FMN-containing dehydrogenase